jgi:general secretion pathway protein J
MRRLPTSGFTVVEVLVSVAILASITAVMWSSISAMFRTRDSAERSNERVQMVRIAVNRMVQEISGAYMAGPEYGGEDIPGEEGQEVEGETESTFQEPVQFGFVGRSDTLHFTSFSHMRTIEGERNSRHAEIGYFLRDRSIEDDDGETRSVQSLMRREDTTLDDDIQRGGTIYVTLPEVEELSFEYWDAGQVKIGTMEEVAEGRWVDSWDTSQREFAGRLPPRVRISVTLPGSVRSPRGQEFTTQATIHVTEILEY